ncbi:MAG: class I SAM-dependent methyltransferase [Candidatus Bathyarchaeota archaeon]|nr:class I SAM-dependent methyltransferase [Candidatus Bathyarchaeum sp.]
MLKKERNELRDFYETIAKANSYYKSKKKFPAVRYRHEKRIEDTIRMMRESRGKMTLDVGCGKGDITCFLALFTRFVIGIDISKFNSKLAKKKSKLSNVSDFTDFVVCDAEKLPFKKTFDYIACPEVIEHIQNPTKFILGMKSVLKKNGHIIVSTPSKFSLLENTVKIVKMPIIRKVMDNLYKIENVGHVHLFSPTDLENLLVSTGGKITKRKITGFYLPGAELIPLQMFPARIWRLLDNVVAKVPVYKCLNCCMIYDSIYE